LNRQNMAIQLEKAAALSSCMHFAVLAGIVFSITSLFPVQYGIYYCIYDLPGDFQYEIETVIGNTTEKNEVKYTESIRLGLRSVSDKLDYDKYVWTMYNGQTKQLSDVVTDLWCDFDDLKVSGDSGGRTITGHDYTGWNDWLEKSKSSGKTAFILLIFAFIFFISGVIVDLYRQIWGADEQLRKLGLMFYALMIVGWIFQISALLQYHNKVFKYEDDVRAATGGKENLKKGDGLIIAWMAFTMWTLYPTIQLTFDACGDKFGFGSDDEMEEGLKDDAENFGGYGGVQNDEENTAARPDNGGTGAYGD